jgi:hypothetical protein
MTERIVLRKIAREMTDLEIASVSGGEGTLGDLLRQQGLDPDDYSLGKRRFIHNLCQRQA